MSLRERLVAPIDVAWPIAIVLAFAALDFAVTIPLGGRSLALAAPQLAVLLVAAGGAAIVLARREVHLDRLLGLYAVLAVVPVVQSRVLDVEAAGGTGIFVTVALLLFALRQYDVIEGRSATVVLVSFGVVLSLWMFVLWALAVADPGGIYDLKRAVGLPIGPGNFVAAVLLVPIMLALGLETTDRWRLPALLALGTGLAVTLSRGGWLVLTVVLALRLVLLRRRERSAAPWPTWQRASVVVGVLALFLIYVFSGSDPGFRLEVLARPAVGPRVTIWQAAIDGILANPIAGFGLDGFAPLTAAVGRFETHPHNMVLAGFGMLGFVGGVAYVALWAVALRRVWSGTKAMTIGLAVTTIALHAQIGAWSLYLVFELLLVVLIVLGSDRSSDTCAVIDLGSRAGRRE